MKSLLRRAGFTDIRVNLRIPEKSPDSLKGQASLSVVSADIRASKPLA